MVMNLKKKFLLFILSFTIIFSGCGSTKYTASNKAIAGAKNAVEIGEKYLSYDLSGKEAKKKMDDILDTLSYIKDYTHENKEEDKEKFADYILYMSLTCLDLAIFNDSGTLGDSESYDKVKDNVKDLKEKIEEYS